MTGRASRQEYEDPIYGWDATVVRFDGHVHELVTRLQEWEERDREGPSGWYGIALQIGNTSRNIDADLDQLARLSWAREGLP